MNKPVDPPHRNDLQYIKKKDKFYCKPIRENKLTKTFTSTTIRDLQRQVGSK